MRTDDSTTRPTTGVDVDSPYELDDQAPARFERDGFVRLAGVLDEHTIAHIEPKITAKVIELNTMHLPMAERSTYNKAFLQVTNLWRHSEQVRQLVFSAKLARMRRS